MEKYRTCRTGVTPGDEENLVHDLAAVRLGSEELTLKLAFS